MIHLSYLAIAAVAIGLLLTLMLASWLTPAHWWRQLNARAVAVVGLGTWGIASLILWLAQVPGTAQAAQPALSALSARSAHTEPARLAPLSANLADAGRSYRVREDLNLRSARGTASARVMVIPAGSVVTTTGVREGDWWQVRTRINGSSVEGWSSSLWLRRAEEGAPR